MESCNPHFLIAFLSVVFVGLVLGIAAESTAQRYWKTMLPNTPMPQAVLDTLPMPDSNDNGIGTVHELSSQPQLIDQDFGDDEKVDAEGKASSQGKIDDFGYEPRTPKSFLHEDFVTSMFFLERDLIPGTKLSVHFKNTMHGARFPSPSLAQRMPPISSRSLKENLRFFSVYPGSETAWMMNHTLVRCEQLNPINGKAQFCAISLDKMVDSVSVNLGDSRHIRAASMPLVHNTDSLVPYKMVMVSKLAEERDLIACHQMSFPYGVFYCHQPKGATAYSVSLQGVQDGVKMDVFALCHDHTSDWNPEYVAFKTLGVSPGTPICHFLERSNVIWYRV